MLKPNSIYRLILTALIAATQHASASEPFQVGEYFRDSELTPGWLTITGASSSVLKFHLVTELRQTGDDGELTRNGVVDESEAAVIGTKAVYRSNQEQHEDIGSCQLDLEQHQQEIIVTQSGNCWWFGEKVNASGVYQKREFSSNTRAALKNEVSRQRLK